MSDDILYGLSYKNTTVTNVEDEERDILVKPIRHGIDFERFAQTKEGKRFIKWQGYADTLSFSEALDLIFLESGIYTYYADTDPTGFSMLNLNTLCDTAKNEKVETVGEFVNWFSDNNSVARKIPEATVKADGVRIMTMHSAKGLEFEIVYVMELSQTYSGFNTSEFYFCPEKGLG
jgi:ATP-dependent exoDNAse (exonuclease V) beta subunit